MAHNGRASRLAASWLFAAILLMPGLLLAEEECLFDQVELRKELRSLVQKHHGSRYDEAGHRLVMPRDGGQLVFRRGGCVHFGITIELTIPGSEFFPTQEAFFAKIQALVAEFARELVDPKELARLIEAEHWHDGSDEDGWFYFLGYEGLTSFEVYQKRGEADTTTGLLAYR